MVVVKWILIVVAVLAAGGGLVLTIGLYRLSRNQPGTDEITLGVSNGRLSPCPRTPNCVSTQADPADKTHYAEPIPWNGSREELLGRLARWITEQPRAEVVSRREEYLRAVFASGLFGFKDDVEVYVPEEQSAVHFRSAARVGQSDMGVNRKRYRQFRDFIEQLEESASD
jgi:uncharacterized protein (DUF1499 family)